MNSAENRTPEQHVWSPLALEYVHSVHRVGGSSPVKGLKRGPLLAVLAVCVLFAVFGGALVGEALGGWYGDLEKPWFLAPLWAFYVVGVLYYLAFAAVLYRVLVHVRERRRRLVCLALALVVMISNELWNYLFFGLRSTLAGFVGIVLFLVPLTALLFALYKHERVSAAILAPYYLWVLYDLAWTFELWRLNSGA
jgi:translocator protein